MGFPKERTLALLLCDIRGAVEAHGCDVRGTVEAHGFSRGKEQQIRLWASAPVELRAHYALLQQLHQGMQRLVYRRGHPQFLSAARDVAIE